MGGGRDLKVTRGNGRTEDSVPSTRGPGAETTEEYFVYEWLSEGGGLSVRV